jgi:hypothetical protein
MSTAHASWVFGLLLIVLWFVLAVAFRLVAKRCSTAHRSVSICAWVTCVSASLAVVPWGFLLINRYIPLEITFLLVPAFLALFAFGVAAHRPFGAGWSIPSMIAGSLGLVGYVSPKFSYAGVVQFGVKGLGALWLLPLLFLGFAMCRSRILPQPNGTN